MPRGRHRRLARRGARLHEAPRRRAQRRRGSSSPSSTTAPQMISYLEETHAAPLQGAAALPRLPPRVPGRQAGRPLARSRPLRHQHARRLEGQAPRAVAGLRHDRDDRDRGDRLGRVLQAAARCRSSCSAERFSQGPRLLRRRARRRPAQGAARSRDRAAALDVGQASSLVEDGRVVGPARRARRARSFVIRAKKGVILGDRRVRVEPRSSARASWAASSPTPTAAHQRGRRAQDGDGAAAPTSAT